MTPASWTGRYATRHSSNKGAGSTSPPDDPGEGRTNDQADVLDAGLMAPEESPEIVLVRMDGRLANLEQRRAEDRRHLDDAVAELKAEMRAGIASIAYVSKEQFADFKTAVGKEMAANSETAAEARKLSLACLWVLIVAVVGGVVGLAFQVAT